MSPKPMDLPTISPTLFAWFERYGRRYTAQHFHALRLAKEGRPDPRELAARPLVVYFNHPSWWDPMVCLGLLRDHFPGRRHYAPIDASALERYRFFAKLGFFGVELDRFAGARRFLKIAGSLLRRPDTVLWVAAEGRFADPRRRPLDLRPGLSHLAAAHPNALFLPLALDYPFWEERFPEALLRFGEATLPSREREAPPGPGGRREGLAQPASDVLPSASTNASTDAATNASAEPSTDAARDAAPDASTDAPTHAPTDAPTERPVGAPPRGRPGRSAATWGEILRQRLERAMDALAEDAISRDPERFESVLRGGAGVGGIYDLWRRFKARLRGERFEAAHGQEERP